MPPTILLAEDHEDNRIALLSVLESGGFTALGASNGREAVEIARSARPDLVVMDLMMPVLDGRGANRELKEDPGTRGIPVLALTAMTLSVSWEELRDEGFAGLLTKPCMPPHLLAEVRRLVGEKDGNGKGG
jgi:CheY-like chemotaxis protein